MTILVLHTPDSKVRQEGRKTFEQTVSDGIGDGYAIPTTYLSRISPGCMVVVIDNETRKRAEGKLVKLVPAGKTLTGMQRYDVYIDNLKVVPYQRERLTRWGIAIID